MRQDIRVPLGWTFLSIGLLLVLFGGLTNGQPMYAVCEGINLNLLWGTVMAVFGGCMLLLRSRKGIRART